MRSRTIREGSVGLLILVGLGLFGGIVLWLRGFNPGARSYIATVEFGNVAGMQAGAPVRYRGVTVGKIAAVRPGANAVEVDIEISPATLVMPKDLVIEANQSGLIGETSIDITPNTDVPSAAVAANPLAGDCDRDLIVCDGSRLKGAIGVSFTELIRKTVQFADLFSNPQFFNEIRTLTRNTSTAAAGVTTLTREVTTLTKSVRQELGTLSVAASTSATSVGQAANQIGLTAAQVNELLATNRSSLVSTLDSINQTSNQLQGVISKLAPQLESGEMLQNLETLSANAADASANLRNLTEAVGSSENILLLQQTLDSARATFQNAQKITADVDELTGDPTFRTNLRNLVNNLSGLVSSTQQLEQQTNIARVLTPEADGADAFTVRSPSSGSSLTTETDPSALAGNQSLTPAVLSLLDTDSRLMLHPLTRDFLPTLNASVPLESGDFSLAPVTAQP